MNEDAVEKSVRHARGSSGQAPEQGLARDLSELARELRAEQSMEAVLQRIVGAAVVEIDGAELAGVTEVVKGQVRTQAATDELVRAVDQKQYEAQDGPCLTSLREQMTVRSNDVASDARWPVFSTAAGGMGVRSMLAVQLFVEGDNLGALNLFSSRQDAFDDADESIAMMLAAHAAVAMKGAKVESNLRAAITNRDLIGQAKGILMERFKIGPDEAFDLLVVSSQQTNVKLSRVADDLASTGEFST